MSRPIKFRVYKKDTKELVYIDDYYELNFEEKGRWFVMIPDDLFCNYLNGVLEQFTGLHDKEGKEIYEGDIVEYETFQSRNTKKKKIKVRRKVYWSDKTCGWVITDDLDEREFSLPFFIKPRFGSPNNHGEVIGNIHENKELLDARQD